MARRQATGFSLSVSRAREHGLSPSFLVPVRSFVRSLSCSRVVLSPSFSLRSVMRRELSSTLLHVLSRFLPLSPCLSFSPFGPLPHKHRRHTGSYTPLVASALTLCVPEDAAEDPPHANLARIQRQTPLVSILILLVSSNDRTFQNFPLARLLAPSSCLL